MTSKTDAISAERWAQIQRIFDDAMDLNSLDRTAYISEQCGDDESLLRQIEALMLAADSEEDLVSNLVRSATTSLINEEERLNKPIGPFKLVEPIGEGGMGVVYLARRDDHEFEQNVAIKVLHKHVISEETQQRFLAERQILADLNHPNIARLLDGGQTEDGQPYIVMEYIDGKPLVEYCDDKQLSVSARLRLFQQVCLAVAEAHRSLIVHRDIKSNNILVGSDGTPKLLDFGIAKVLGNQLGELDLAKTQIHDRLLTPDSASPEQITGQSITTATDIYSLGILLYELLVGCRPFRLSSSTAGQMERTICNEVPMAPSAALDSLLEQNDTTREIAAQNRSCSPGRLYSQLRGELDSIVLMALKKEPRRRYRSANDFADDVSRFMQGEPIRAVRDSRSYRAIKFFSRNRIPVAVAALFIAAVTAFGITNFIQSKEIAAQASALADQARKVVTETENTYDTITYLGSVFAAASPEGLQIKEPSALDVLNFAEQKIADDLAGRPEIMGRLLQTIASAYEGQGESAKALENYKAAMALFEESYGQDSPLMAGVLHDLGRYYWTRDGALASDYYQRALAIFEQPETASVFSNNPDRHLSALQKLKRDIAILETAQGQLEAAEVNLNSALEMSKQLTPNAQSSKEVSQNLATLGALNLRLGKFELSDRYYIEALDEYRRTHNPKDTYVAQLLNERALAKHAQGDLASAEVLYREGVNILETVFDANDSRLLQAKADLGRFLGTQGKLDQAKKLLQEATDGSRLRGGDATRELGFNLVQLAIIETRRENFDQAESLFDEAIVVYNNMAEPNHGFVGEAYRQYGNLKLKQEQYEDAILWFDEALSVLLQKLGERHWQTAATLSDKAEALLRLERLAQARTLLDTALPVLDELLGPEHRLVQTARERRQRAQ